MFKSKQATDPRIAAVHAAILNSLPEGDRDRFDLAKIKPSTPLRGLPLDSITMIELLDHLKETFGSELAPEDVYNATTVGDLIKLIPLPKDD